ncbi:hypothetical protein BC940DRAFT_240873, partial [Gongronella butleri]
MQSSDVNHKPKRRSLSKPGKPNLQISLPPPPTPAELGLRDQNHQNNAKNKSLDTSSTTTPDLSLKLAAATAQMDQVSAEEFAGMSRDQLIARLVELEQEKRAHHHSPPTSAACDTVLDGLKQLNAHLSEVHVGSGKTAYVCEWENCLRQQKPFVKRHKMLNHLRTHTGERPYLCPQEDCGKRFSRPDSLTTHIKTHSNIRPYYCSIEGCDKSYYHARSLKKHERMHE